MRRAILVVLAIFAVHVSTAAADDVTGFTTIGPYSAKVDVYLAPGASTSAGNAVLSALHATTTPSNLFNTSGYAWPQFFDPGRADDRVIQSYNPSGGPVASLTAVQDALATWSMIPGSSFRFGFGGTTSRCPSLMSLVPGFCAGAPPVGFPIDGFNDLGWGPLRAGILGLTVTAFRSTGQEIESDVGLNSLYTSLFRTDGTDIDVETVVVHEDGHVAGLAHSPDPGSIMYPVYRGVVRTPDQTDIDAMSFLYPTKPATFVDTPAAYGFRVLARAGDPAPGGGTFQNDFELGALNGRGDLAFVSDVDEGEALFLASNGELRQVARSGLSLAGFTLGSPGAADVVGLNDLGEVAFAWLFDPFGLPFGSNAGLFLVQGNAVRALVVPGTPAPGGGVFDGAQAVRISNRGDIVFTGVVGGVYGVFVAHRDGSIVEIARAGEPAPRGGVFGPMIGTTITDRGDVGFSASTSLARVGVFVSRAAGQLEEIAGPGDPAPGGGTFFDAVSPRVNAHGDVLFGGRTFTSTGALSRGIYEAHDGTIDRIAGFGEVMPDGWRYVTTVSSVASWALNNRGEVAFMAVVQNDAGARTRAIYAGRPGALSLVARVGTVVPGLGGIFALPFEVNQLATDDRGDVAFVASTFAGLTLVEAAPKA